MRHFLEMQNRDIAHDQYSRLRLRGNKGSHVKLPVVLPGAAIDGTVIRRHTVFLRNKGRGIHIAAINHRLGIGKERQMADADMILRNIAV